MSRVVFSLMVEDVSGKASKVVSIEAYENLEAAKGAALRFYEGESGNKWPSWIEWLQAGRIHWSADVGQWVFGITQRKLK